MLVCLLSLTSLRAADTAYWMKTFAGSDSIGDGGAPLAALLRQAEGLAVDSAGNLYIADAADHRIRKIAADGAVQTVAGTGTAGASGDNGPATNAQLNSPYGIAIDTAGNLYIADLGNGLVRRVTADGVIQTVAGGGTQATTALTASTRATQVKLNMPRNIAVDSNGVVYFSDFGAHQILRITNAGTIELVAGTGKAGDQGDNGPALSATINFPAGLAIDKSGVVYFADSGNRRIRRIAQGRITAIASPQLPFILPTGVALEAGGSLLVADVSRSQMARLSSNGTWTSLAEPARDVTVDSTGAIYFSRYKRVMKIGKDGNIAIYAGSGLEGFVGESTPALSSRLQQPNGMAYDAAGNLYLADSANHRIRRIGTDGVMTTLAGTGEKGYAGDGGLARDAKLNGPSGVVVDSTGEITFTDTGNNAVRRIGQDGKIRTLAGNGKSGYSGDAGPAANALIAGPTAITLDRLGNVIFADSLNHAVRRITPEGMIQTLAGGYDAGYAGDGKPGIFAQLNNPEGVAADKDGNIWIADTKNAQIRRIDIRGTIQTIGFSQPSRWKQPRGLAVLDSGDLLVVDSGLSRVFQISADGTITPVAGNGVSGSSDEEGAALDLPLSNPVAVIAAADGSVLISDAGANRIRRLTKITPTAPVQSGVTALHGASYLAQPVAPGQVLVLFGTGIGPATAQPGAVGANGLMPTSLNGTQVLFDNIAAPLYFAQSNQINVQVPYEVQGRKLTQISVRRNQSVVSTFAQAVAESSPGLFADANGTVIARNQDGSLNASATPAPKDSIVTLYATGEGQTQPGGVSGKPADFPYPQPVLPVTVDINGISAPVLFSGAAPGLIGLLQVNVRIPAGLANGPQPITLSVGGVRSQPGIRVFVK